MVSSRRSADKSAADSEAVRVSLQLRGAVQDLDLVKVWTAVAIAEVDGLAPTEFPGKPEIEGAVLWSVPAVPSRVELTYRVDTHGVSRCVTATAVSGDPVTVHTTNC